MVQNINPKTSLTQEIGKERLEKKHMEPVLVNLGRSLPVPCVKELAKEHKDNVPLRYIRPDQDQTIIPVGAYEVPVIDMGKLLAEESTDSELAKLDLACKEWGFFQLINHEVDSSLIEKIKKEVQDFFNLPMEEKKKYWQLPGDVEGFGQVFVVSEEQKLDWSDVFALVTRPVSTRKPYLFPKLPLPFRDTLDAYSLAVHNLGMAIVGLLGKALNMEEEMKELFDEEAHQAIRMNYYPPCPRPDQVVGFTPHSDASALTILLQVNEAQGLQIRKDGKWIPVQPLPNAFVVNIGDFLEIISNGIYPSMEHRATVNSGQERFSVAAFQAPGFKKEIGPASSLISAKTPAKYRRITIEDFFKGLFARELKRTSYLDSMRL